MFGKHEKSKSDLIKELALKLIETAKIDSVYRDIYLSRARKIISETMPPEEYDHFLGERRWLSRLPNKISASMEKGDWKAVKELSERMVTLTKWEEDMRYLLEIGDEVYETDEVVLDPFSSGFNHLAGIPYADLAPLRDGVANHLEELQKEDPSYKAFYRGRYNSLRSLSLIRLKKGHVELAELDKADLQERAEQALNHGDIELLEEIAKLLLNKETSKDIGPGILPTEMVHHDSARTTTFSKNTLTKAESLGLTAVHLDESKEYESLFRYAFHPVMDKDPEKAWEKMTKKETEFPSDTPEILKEHIRLYAVHTFLTSGGSRYLPDFVAEDCLVEVFPEPSKTNGDRGSELLSLLGFEHRRGLSRKQIEHALLQNGPWILEEKLGLKPELFRIVCIPPDIYLRLGPSHEWGRQEIWTHFDGYQADQKGNLKALAGGDVRFGGVYDLVSIGREYVSDHVITRFAVIQRKRMSNW
jgi:hypothetical protein